MISNETLNSYSINTNIEIMGLGHKKPNSTVLSEFNLHMVDIIYYKFII